MEGLLKVHTICTFTWQCIYFEFWRMEFREWCFGRVIPTLGTTNNVATTIVIVAATAALLGTSSKDLCHGFFILFFFFFFFRGGV
jgi:hypothetical protein